MAEDSDEKAILILRADIIASPSEVILGVSLTDDEQVSSGVEWLLLICNLFSINGPSETAYPSEEPIGCLA